MVSVACCVSGCELVVPMVGYSETTQSGARSKPPAMGVTGYGNEQGVGHGHTEYTRIDMGWVDENVVNGDNGENGDGNGYRRPM